MRYQWELYMFGDHYYSSHWDIIAYGMIDRNWSEITYFRRCNGITISSPQVASGSVEENATLRV